MSVIDPERLRDARLAAGLSMTALAAKVGRTLPTIRGLESGTDAKVTLGTVAAVAEAVGVPLAELLMEAREGDKAAPAGTAQDVEGLALRLEATLFIYGRELTVASLAQALGETEGRVRSAGELLAVRLKDRGIRLVQHVGGRLNLRPADVGLTKKALNDLERGYVLKEGLTLQTARVLLEVLHAQSGTKRTYGIDKNNYRVALGRLQRAGLVETHAATLRPILSDDVMFALNPALNAMKGDPKRKRAA